MDGRREECPAVTARAVGLRMRLALALGEHASVRTLTPELRRYASLPNVSILFGLNVSILFGLETLAVLESIEGRHTRVAQLFGAAQAERERRHDPWWPKDHAQLDCYLNASRQQLGEAGFAAAWAEGQAMSLEEAIALGLVDHKAAVPSLMEELKTGGSPDLKGHVSTALGLMGEKTAIPLIQEMAKKVSDLDSQRRASIALGLIGDPNAVKVLIKVIEDAQDNLSALGGAAVALGFIGDRSAVPTMNAMLLKRDQYKDNARAFAAVALGILGDKSDLPLLSKVQENCNYLATTESLTEILLIY